MKEIKTQNFYLDSERFSVGCYHSGDKISLPVYQEVNNQKERFSLVFSKKDNLVPFPWFCDIRSSLLINKDMKITLQATYEDNGLLMIGEEEETIINPQSIQGNWKEAEKWLTENYPTKESRQFITHLDCSKQILSGCLDLSSFPRLKEVNCSSNYLEELIVSEQVKKVNASFNNITSLKKVKVNWETIEFNLNNNPLDIAEIVQTVKDLHKNSELERQEIEKSRLEIEKLKQSITVIKNNHKENFKTLQTEHQQQIEAAQATVQELDKKLTEKEQELKKKRNGEQLDSSLVSSDGSWWVKNKTSLICGAIGLFLLGVGYIFYRIFKF